MGERQTDRDRHTQSDRDRARQNASISDTKIPRLIKQAQPTVSRQRSQGFNPAVQTPVPTPFDTQPSPLRHCARTRPPSLANSSSVSHCPYVHQQVPPAYLQSGQNCSHFHNKGQPGEPDPGGRGGQSREGDERRSFVSR